MFLDGCAQAIRGFLCCGLPVDGFAIDFGFQQAEIALHLGGDRIDQGGTL